MVGDRLDDVRTGVRAGIRAVLLAATPVRDPATRAYCRRHGVPVFPSLVAFVDHSLLRGSRGHAHAIPAEQKL